MTTIHFFLRYHSEFGQSFFVSGNIPALGNNDPGKALAIKYLNEEYWTGSVELPSDVESFTYQYLLCTQDGLENPEGGHDRTLVLSAMKGQVIQVFDTWNYAGEYENAFFTQPFTDTLLKTGNGVYSYTCALFSKAFVGIHPQLRQMPPKDSFSMIATFLPS